MTVIVPAPNPPLPPAPLIRLDSDFTDYYDHWFVGSSGQYDATYRRQSKSGPSRPRLLLSLHDAGLPVPMFGPVEALSQQEKIETVVVYLDVYAHRGEGKVRLPIDVAKELYPTSPCSEFIPTTDTPEETSKSYRHLFIGNQVYHLTYESNTWLSNVGEVEIEVIPDAPLQVDREIFSRSRVFNESPILAFDYVKDPETGFVYCIDLNIAPGLKGTGIEFILPGKNVVQAVSEYLAYVGEIDF